MDRSAIRAQKTMSLRRNADDGDQKSPRKAERRRDQRRQPGLDYKKSKAPRGEAPFFVERNSKTETLRPKLESSRCGWRLLLGAGCGLLRRGGGGGGGALSEEVMVVER